MFQQEMKSLTLKSVFTPSFSPWRRIVIKTFVATKKKKLFSNALVLADPSADFTLGEMNRCSNLENVYADSSFEINDAGGFQENMPPSIVHLE